MLSMYRDSKGKTVVDIKDCETMREVKILKMGGLGLTDFDVQMFSQLTNIEEMDVSDNQLDAIPECIRLPKLRRLDCSNNRFSDLQFVSQFPSLEEVTTDGNQVAFADLCIASYLCPGLKRVNDQTIDIQALNRKIENRIKPTILKVWNNHVKPLYRHSMTESEFQTIAEKLRVLLKHAITPTMKTISKFQAFRVSLLIDEFLSKVRNAPLEEDIEFGGSADSVKKNYTKKKKKGEEKKEEVGTDLRVENLDQECEALVEEQLGTAAVVVAVADEDGNGVLTIDDVATILSADQLKEASTVTIFVENVDAVAEMETEEDSSTTDDKSSSLEAVIDEKEKDFIDFETERLKALDEAKNGDISENDREERLKSKNPIPPALDEGGNGDERKVVRYWMYEGPKPKSLPSHPGTGISPTSSSLNKKENNPVNGTKNTGSLVSSLANNARRTAVVSCRGRASSKIRNRARSELISKMKSDGTIPTVPKFKVPAIDARQAAMVVCEMHSAPMVVYRGRSKRGSWSSYSAKSTTKQTAKTEVVVNDSDLTSVETAKFPIAYESQQKSTDSSNSKDTDLCTETKTDSCLSKGKLPEEGHVRDVCPDSKKCPPKKRVRFSDQDGDDSNVL